MALFIRRGDTFAAAQQAARQILVARPRLSGAQRYYVFPKYAPSGHLSDQNISRRNDKHIYLGYFLKSHVYHRLPYF